MQEFNSRKVYDDLSLRYEKYCRAYWCRYGVELVERMAPPTGARVLDVACGTGSSAIPAAVRVGTNGRVVAVDTSEGMLHLAKDKAAALGLDNIEFLTADMRDIDLAPESFDHVLSAFGIFFVADMPAALSKLWSLLKPGGHLGLAVWGSDFLEPMHKYWKQTMNDAAPDVDVTLPWERVHEGNIAGFMKSAGINDVRVTSLHAPLVLEAPEHWWDIVTSTGLVRFLQHLTDDGVRDVRAKNMRHIQEEDISVLDIDTVFAFATKPKHQL